MWNNDYECQIHRNNRTGKYCVFLLLVYKNEDNEVMERLPMDIRTCNTIEDAEIKANEWRKQYCDND